ncbi:Receptor-like protein EIX2 [Senna tora]|uniref:Receptor-like protein EIX2 n=1 Tax=Senna tora TaxID=362788 RepID=A0A834VY79_9FABA|nr:Receptor-like protein EIX2 [Senna tora]
MFGHVEMPPKRNKPSSSSSSNWDTTRFASKAAEKRYKRNFLAASAISERGMFLAEENFNDVPILEVVSSLKWNSFIEAPKQRGVSSIVREFYANYPDHKDGKMPSHGLYLPHPTNPNQLS